MKKTKKSDYDKKWNKEEVEGRRIIKTYEYFDEKGELLFEAVRYEPKAFRQRRPDGAGTGYIWNLKETRRVLYRLPELIKGSDPVFILEGEKDVDSLRKWNLTATCNPMGAEKWKSQQKEYNPFLKGRGVVIIPDNDPEGERHLDQVASSLKGTAKSVKVLRLPDAKDFSDWKIKDKNNTEEKFLMLVSESRDWKKKGLLQQAPPDERKSLESKQKAKAEIRTLIPGLVHLVRQDGIVKYLLKKGDGLSIEETFTLNDVIYKPKQDLPVKIPDEGILTEPARLNYDELLQEVLGFIKAYLEMPSESHYLILALWIFHTYLVEKFKTTPILYFYGVKETGKTRAGEVLGELAFRCERLTSPTEATLFRSASYFKTSLIIDEIKLWGQDGNPDVARLIKSRYKRGLMVSRINLNKKGEDQVEYFDVFAPLVICTTESIPDAIESRCITFLMQKNARAEVERPVDEDRGGKLRNRLTLFRASHLDRDLPEAEQLARRRLNEIMLPLYQVLMLIDPKRKEAFKMIVEEMETAKEEEEGLSLEAEIVEEIIDYRKDTGQGAFLTTEIADRLNEERSEKEKITNMLVSVRIKRLGFQKVRLANGKRGFRISSELLKKLAFQFGLDYDSFLTT